MHKLTQLCRERDAIKLLITSDYVSNELQRELLKVLIDVEDELKQIERDNHTLTI